MLSFLSGLLSNPLDPGASARHASEAQNTASGLQQQASGYYNQLGNEGSALTSLYNANISPLLSLYGQYGGVGNVLTNPTSANTPSTTAGGAASGTTNVRYRIYRLGQQRYVGTQSGAFSVCSVRQSVSVDGEPAAGLEREPGTSSQSAERGHAVLQAEYGAGRHHRSA